MPLSDEEIRMRIIEVIAPIWATTPAEAPITTEQWRSAFQWMLAAYIKGGLKPQD